jgi:LysR family transcriptional activator of nhaA
MEWLNYHHLLYFWVVAREGSIVRASAQLHLAQPTISSQLRALEEALGEKLFARAGRHLVLTDMGRVVFRYAEEIFTLGRELVDTVRGRPTGRPLRVLIGVTDVLPKMVVYRLLAPLLCLTTPVQIVCREGKLEGLLTDLGMYSLDVVLSDAPLTPAIPIRAFNHLLGECGVTFCGTAPLARTYWEGFPHSLAAAPLLLPTLNTTLRRALDHWFETEGLRPRVVGEFEDSALLKAFGEQGLGLFVIPSLIESEVQQKYSVEVLGRVESIRERFYAITLNRKLRHPAIVAMSEAARHAVFHASEEGNQACRGGDTPLAPGARRGASQAPLVDRWPLERAEIQCPADRQDAPGQIE